MRIVSFERAAPEDMLWILAVFLLYVVAGAVWWIVARTRRRRQSRDRSGTSTSAKPYRQPVTYARVGPARRSAAAGPLRRGQLDDRSSCGEAGVERGLAGKDKDIQVVGGQHRGGGVEAPDGVVGGGQGPPAVRLG